MWLGLTAGDLVALSAIGFAAGIVRGFTGFGYSAFAMALAVLILPPVALIPVLWWPELTASLATLRGGWREGDRKAAVLLVIGATLGTIAGLSLTTRIDPDLSARVALVVLIGLALMQLVRLRLPGLDTTGGTVLTGLTAGLVTGLAGVGGMVIALFVLARDAQPRAMRGTLILFLLFASLTSFGAHLWFGTMTWAAVQRGLWLSAPSLVGVWLGVRLFVPRWERWYRPVCLILLIGLAALSLARALLGGGA